jgi:hypothetical protein
MFCILFVCVLVFGIRAIDLGRLVHMRLLEYSKDKMSNTSDEQFVIESQEILEEQIIVKFDFPRIKIAPRIGALILCQLGFGVVAIVGVSSNEAQAGDIVVELVHNGFYTRAQVWVKMQDGTGGWVSSARSSDNITLLLILRRVTTHYSEKQKQVPQLCDV